jgi:hypothetical protein
LEALQLKVNYDLEFFCSAGGHTVPHGQEQVNGTGIKLCPTHGKRLRARVAPGVVKRRRFLAKREARRPTIHCRYVHCRDKSCLHRKLGVHCPKQKKINRWLLEAQSNGKD